MKALCLKEPYQMSIEEVNKPVLTEDNAIVKMEMCGICGSDITAYKGVNPTVKYPVIGAGHEGIGVITEIGQNEKGLKVGDRVALEPYIPCRKCHSCKEERFNNCVNIQVAGVHTGGMMTEYFSHPVSLLYKVPEELSLEKATLVEPLTIALHGVTRAQVKPGEFCIVTGAGPIGLLAALVVRAYGATPILVDILEDRLKFANSIGIELTYNSNNNDGLVEYLKKVTNGKLPEALVDCTGSSFIISKMHDYVCHGGRIAIVGWPKSEVMVNIVRCIQKELAIFPSRNSNKKFPEAIDLINSGKIDVEKLITKIINIDATEDTIKDIIENPNNYMKVLVRI